MTVPSSSVLAFTTLLRVRRSRWSFRGCRVHSELKPWLILRPASWLALLVCLFPASTQYWRQRREECCNPPESLTSFERLLPPARAQGFGTSCGLDRLSQGSPCPRSSGGDSRLPRRRMSPGSLPVFSLRRSPVSTIASLDRIGVGIDTARYGHRV